MRIVHTSKLSEVKSVFNSEADNVQYYNVLKNSNCIKFYNVELAKPVLRKSKGEVLWQTDSNIEFKQLSSLPENQRIKYGKDLEKFFKDFKNKFNKFSNISDDFIKKVMEIPDWNSILVNETKEYIVIVNWGFLEDKFNRRVGIIETLFPVPDQSILVKLINEKDEPINGQKIILSLLDEERSDYTNTNGYARFGTLTRGKSFNLILSNEGTGSIQSFDFVCDGRKEYTIKAKENVIIKIIAKDNQGKLLENQSFYVSSPLKNNEVFNTKQLGHFKFNHKIVNDFFEIKDLEDKLVFKEKIPNDDATFIINYEENQNDINEPKTKFIPQLEDKQPLKFLFLNTFNKPIKSFNVNFEYQNQAINKTTDNNGEIQLDLNVDKEEKLEFLFNRYNRLWNNSIQLNPERKLYIIKTKPIFPWLWWLLIFILIILLWYCEFCNCFCNDKKNNTPVVDNDQKPVKKEEVITSSCDVETVSGGNGVTKTNHVLGDKSGMVELVYDMQDIPDKLEVYYQGELVISTFRINGNDNGFVGGELSSGPSAILKFNYQKDKDDFVTVVVTGPNENTIWDYVISCPK
jgi:hypothetical protein